MTEPTFTDEHRWRAAVDEWQTHLERIGLAESTRVRLRRQLTRFGREIDKRPYLVTGRDLYAWEQTHPEWTPTVLYSFRTALRSFYRWAHKAGKTATDPAADRGHPLMKPAPAGWTDALDEFAAWMKSRHLLPSTIKLRRHHMTQVARQTGAPTPWSLDDRDLSEWMGSHNWGREGARAALASVRMFYRWAELRGYVDVSPATVMGAIATPPPVPRPASEDAYRRALIQADDRTRLMLRLAAELGLRRAEVAGVHGRNIDQDAGGSWWLLIDGKGRRLRRLPLSESLARELRQHGPGHVFPGKVDGHLSPDTVGHLVKNALPDGYTMHQLRHRFATQAWTASRDLFAVQRLLGHSSPNTTQRYVATTDDQLRGVMAAVANQTGPWA